MCLKMDSNAISLFSIWWNPRNIGAITRLSLQNAASNSWSAVVQFCFGPRTKLSGAGIVLTRDMYMFSQKGHSPVDALAKSENALHAIPHCAKS